MGRPVDAHHLMLCTDNEAGASQFPSTEVDTPAVNPDVAHACAMELCGSCPVIEFGSRTTSRLPCHHLQARGRTIVRVLPEERSSTKPVPEERRASPEQRSPEQRKAADERKTAERKATPGERQQSNTPKADGTPVPDSKS